MVTNRVFTPKSRECLHPTFWEPRGTTESDRAEMLLKLDLVRFCLRTQLFAQGCSDFPPQSMKWKWDSRGYNDEQLIVDRFIHHTSGTLTLLQCDRAALQVSSPKA